MKEKDKKIAKEELEKISKEMNPIEFLQVLADGAAFCKKAEKYEAKLHKKLDKMVEDGEIDEHQARWKFYEEFEQFTEDEAKKTADRIRWLSGDCSDEEVEEDDDDDAEDESRCCCAESEDDDADAIEREAHRKALEELKKILGDTDGDGLSFDVRCDVFRRKPRG